MQCLVNMVDESELPSQDVTVLPGHQRNVWSCVIPMGSYAFSIDKLQMLFVGCCFQLVSLGSSVKSKSISGSFHLPPNLFHSTLLYSIHFSLPITICFKNRTLSFHFSRELHVGKGSRFFVFSLMWNPNIEATNITKIVQMIFRAWFEYF